MRYLNQREDAVSPVVGVMLLLVVTIIIAAVVSAFGGSLMESDGKAPQASITGRYSQYNGLTMTHNDGESLQVDDIYVVLRPSDEFGRGQGEYGHKIVNLSTITDVKGNRWIKPETATYGVLSWRPGESMYVRGGDDLNCSNIITHGFDKDGKEFGDWPPCYNDNLQGNWGGGNYCFVTGLNNQFNIGKTVTLEIYQKNGKLISSSPMVIEP